MPNPHDALFRQVFSEPSDMEGLLRSALPGPLARAIAWDSLTLLPSSFVDEGLREHHGDLLFEVRIGERRALLYVLCEHKSHRDADTVFQLLRYVLRIWESWRRDHPGSALPPVVPFVLHHATGLGPGRFVYDNASISAAYRPRRSGLSAVCSRIWASCSTTWPRRVKRRSKPAPCLQ